jgi:hypothetical protein
MFYLSGVSFIGLLSGLTGYLLLTSLTYSISNVHSYVVPVGVAVVIGGTVGRVFMSVYSKVADALLVLFTIDEEIARYHGGEPNIASCPGGLNQMVNYS